MSDYFTQYFKLLRSGFLKQSYKLFALLILVCIVLGSKISTDVEVILFTFLGMGIFSDLDEKKYILTSSLPMKVKTRIMMLYMNTYVICCLGGVFMQVAYLVRGEARPITETLIVIFASVIGCNLYYLLFASNEFKKDPQEQVGIMLAFVFALTIVGMILWAIHLWGEIGIISYSTSHLSIIHQGIFLAILMFFTAIINHLSYKKVSKEVFIRD